MKLINFYILLLLLVSIQNSTFGMLKKVEDAVINAAEKLYDKADEFFKVKDELLFENKKPVEIIQFPFANQTTTAAQQTHEIAKSLISKLSKQGLTLENVKKSKLYFLNPKDAALAIKVLKDTYPQLGEKTTLHQWDDAMPNEGYKLFIEIKAIPGKKSKKAKL